MLRQQPFEVFKIFRVADSSESKFKGITDDISKKNYLKIEFFKCYNKVIIGIVATATRIYFKIFAVSG